MTAIRSRATLQISYNRMDATVYREIDKPLTRGKRGGDRGHSSHSHVHDDIYPVERILHRVSRRPPGLHAMGASSTTVFIRLSIMTVTPKIAVRIICIVCATRVTMPGPARYESPDRDRALLSLRNFSSIDIFCATRCNPFI